MQLVILLLLVVALGFLVLGLIASSPPLVIASVVASAVALLMMLRHRRRASDRLRGNGTLDGGAEHMHAPSAAVRASDIIEAQRAASVIEVGEEPAPAATVAPVSSHGSYAVVVVDGHPRYHVPLCRYLRGRANESIPLRQAVEDGFTPCALCDPDSVLAASPMSSTSDG